MDEYLVYTILIGTIGENVFQLDDSFGVINRIELNRHVRDGRPNRRIQNHRPNDVVGSRCRVFVFQSDRPNVVFGM